MAASFDNQFALRCPKCKRTDDIDVVARANAYAYAIPNTGVFGDDGPKRCPECETPNQFGQLCARCRREEAEGAILA